MGNIEWNKCVGSKYNNLKVLSIYGLDKYKRPLFECLCECGNKKIISATRVKNGVTKSCGCLQKKTASKLLKVHGLTNTRLHGIWTAMINRCENPKNNRFYSYGAKGIKVCEKWRNDFQSFYEWAMSNGYSDDLSIDRIDNSKDYCPSNCKWSTTKEQANNKTTSRLIEYLGETKNAKQWADFFGVDYKYFHENLKKNNWDIEIVLNKPYYKEKLKCD